MKTMRIMMMVALAALPNLPLFAQQSSTDATGTLVPAADLAGTGTANRLAKWMDNAGTLGDSSIFDNGNLGIGTTAPGGVFDVRRNSSADLMMRVWNEGTGGSKLRYASHTNATAQLQFTDTFEYLAAIANNGATGLQFRVTPVGGGGNEAALSSSTRMTITRTGRVGIGTAAPAALFHVAGDVMVDGNIAAKYQDVAEWVPVTTSVVPGTVVILNPEGTNEVMPSVVSYDTRVAGVVSEKPGLLLGEASDKKAMIATTGRVKVRVDASKFPIRVGDLLVTSDKAGVAMASQALDLNGIEMHRPGTLIGKALEPKASGEGEILVLLSLQ